MVDSATWIDVGMAAVPVVGTLAGTALGAWWQGRQAEQNNAHARAVAQEERDAAAKRARDERLDAMRHEILADAAEFLPVAEEAVSVANLAFANAVERLDHAQRQATGQVQTLGPAVLEASQGVEDIGNRLAVPVNALLLKVQDESVRKPLEGFLASLGEAVKATMDLRHALRDSDMPAVRRAAAVGRQHAGEAQGALEAFKAATRELLGVRLAPPEPAALPASETAPSAPAAP